jgi:hypothetical protein
MRLDEALNILNEAGYSITKESEMKTNEKTFYIMEYLYEGLKDFCEKVNSESDEDIIEIDNDITDAGQHTYLFKVEMKKAAPFYIMSDNFYVTGVIEIKFIWGSITYAPVLRYKHEMENWSDELIDNALDEIKSYIIEKIYEVK